MPDISEVEDALCDVIVGVFYPGGIPAGDMPPSPVVGLPVRVFRGWPDASEEDEDLANGIVNVSVSPVEGMTANKDRFDTEWYTVVPAAPTLTASASGDTATFGGAAGVQQLAGIRIGSKAYSVVLGAQDDPADAAAMLAAQVPGALATGSQVQVPGSRMEARVQGFATVQREIDRDEQVFRIAMWCPSQPSRDAVASALRPALSGRDFLPLPEHTEGRLKYRSTYGYERMTKTDLWRRDLLYSVEYPTVETQTAPCVMWGSLVYSDTNSGRSLKEVA